MHWVKYHQCIHFYYLSWDSIFKDITIFVLLKESLTIVLSFLAAAQSLPPLSYFSPRLANDWKRSNALLNGAHSRSGQSCLGDWFSSYRYLLREGAKGDLPRRL